MDLEKRLKHLEDEFAKLQQNGGERTMARLMPSAAHLAETRGAFVIEILRAKGLLDDLPLDAITARVKEIVAGDSIPYSVTKQTALEHVDGILSEIAGDYSWADE